MDQPHKIDLNEYISQSKLRLKKILDRLEWSEEATLKDFNTNSVASSFKEAAKTPPSPIKATYPASCTTINSLVLESSKLQEILQSNKVKAPCNFRELQENFSREQKLQIYEHVIKNTEKIEATAVEQKVEGELSFGDILAQKKREEKHKKRRFRKSIPTHIEEVRCLVDLQMQAFQQFMENKIKKEEQRDKNRNERIRFEDYYRRERSREKVTECYKINETKRRHRSRSKEGRHKRYKVNSSKDISYARKRHTKSRSKERRKWNRSSSNDSRHEGSRYSINNSAERRKQKRRSRSHKNISMERNEHRSRSSDRYNRHYKKEISKGGQKYERTHSYETYTRRDEHNYGQKYSRRENGTYYEHSNEKSCEKYLSKSVDIRPQSMRTKNYDEECKRTTSSKLETR